MTMTSSSELFEFAPLQAAGLAQLVAPPAPVPPGAPAVMPTSAQRAVDVVAQAEARAAQIEATARQDGFAQGYAEGAAAARAELAPALEALAAAVTSAEGVREQWLERAERHAVELAISIAEKIVAGRVDTDAETVLSVVEGALRRTADRDHLVVCVNPVDFELVRSAAEELANRLGGIGRLEIVSERRVSRGGCVVRTGEGEIDARLEQQLEAVRNLFAAALDEAAGVEAA
jgi:flagellar assembly protein FliH